MTILIENLSYVLIKVPGRLVPQLLNVVNVGQSVHGVGLGRVRFSGEVLVKELLEFGRVQVRRVVVQRHPVRTQRDGRELQRFLFDILINFPISSILAIDHFIQADMTITKVYD